MVMSVFDNPRAEILCSRVAVPCVLESSAYRHTACLVRSAILWTYSRYRKRKLAAIQFRASGFSV